MSHLILAVFVVYGEWVNLAIANAWHFYKPILTVPTAIYILFLFLLTNVLIVSRFG